MKKSFAICSLLLGVLLGTANPTCAESAIAPTNPSVQPQANPELKPWDDGGSFQVSLFTPEPTEDLERLTSQTKLMFFGGLGVAGVLALMPTSLSGWKDDYEIGALPQKWWDNVSRPPVWDHDAFWINYIAHPYVGGIYYQVARKSGYGQWDSFTYSALMSTFFWEYGMEAFAERPSIQDLIVTPIGGWLLGESMHQLEKEILNQKGYLWGSKELGNLALFLLDPIESAGKGINSLFGYEVVKVKVVTLTTSSPTTRHGENDPTYLGIRVVMAF